MNPTDMQPGDAAMARERQRSGDAIRRLLRWAHGTRFEDIPAEALRRGARILGDDLGAMVAAGGEPEVLRLQQRMLDDVARHEATVFRGGRPRTGRRQAAIANAAAADWLELDEGYRLTPCHAGLYTLPALLAEAEAQGRRVSELLRALVLGYEIVTRIARGWTPANLAMHAHARYAAVGASAATALLRGVDEPTLLAAVTAAGSLVQAGPRDHAAQGALVRNVWPAVGACNGMLAVDWAECGIGGVPEVFHDVFVLLLGGTPSGNDLAESLGRDWAVLSGYTKTHACCQQLHSAVEAALDLRTRLRPGDTLDAIESVTVETHPLAMPLDRRDPPTTLGARFSLPHAVATALSSGEAGVQAFSSATLRAPALDALRRKVRMTAFSPRLPPPHDRPARVTLRFADGWEVQGVCMSAPGGPDQPLGDSAVLDKIGRLAGSTYPGLRGVIESIMSLDPQRLAQPWTDVVEELCTPAA